MERSISGDPRSLASRRYGGIAPLRIDVARRAIASRAGDPPPHIPTDWSYGGIASIRFWLAAAFSGLWRA
jgi:hypothetical protein